jgi:S1-C subfamily serine protease
VQAALAGVTGAVGVAGSGALDADMAAAISKAVQSAVSGQVGSAAIKVMTVPGGAMAAGGAASADAKGAHTWLGIGTTEVGDEVRAQLPLGDGVGVLVSYVADDSPASKAGIQVNDILTKLDDQVLINSAQFRQLVRARQEGDAVALRGLRKGKEKTFRATLGRKESGEDAATIHVISFGGEDAGLKMEIPAEIKRLMESHAGAGATMFSTNIVISGHTSIVIRPPASQAAP